MRAETPSCIDPSLDGLSSSQQKRIVRILESLWNSPQSLSTEARQRLLSENSDLGSYLQDALDGLACFTPLGHDCAESTLERQVIGGFEIEREIGRGGMGVVYAARRVADNQEVAIKVLQKHSASSSKLERFQREAKAASAVHHPSIVPVYESGFDQDTYFLCMQLIEGDSLADWIRNGHLDLRSHLHDESCRTLSREFSLLAEGLHYVHRAGILHRDIKPSNILVDRTGHLWMFDFGLAYIFDGDCLTRTGDLLGTFRYMSPEQTKGGAEFLDVRTDIYSLGLSLYEAITGHHPFENIDSPKLLNAIQSREPIPPSQFWAGIPRDLETIVMRAIRPDKSARYATAMELADDLMAFAENRAIKAKRVTFVERSRSWMAKNPERLLVVLCALGLSTLGLAVHSVVLQKQKSETQQQWERGNLNFEQARDAVDSLGFEFATKLASIPGTEEIQKEVLRETLRYYNGFLKRSDYDPSLQKDAAITQWKIAKLTQLSGKQQDFFSTMNDAISRMETVWLASREQSTLSLLVQAKVEMAWELLKQKEWAEANRLLEQCRTHVVSFHPTVDNRFESSLISNAQSAYHFHRGNVSQAIALAKETLESINLESRETDESKSLDVDRRNRWVMQAAADALSNMAVLLTDHREYHLATQAIERSIELQKNQLASNEGRNLALSLNNLASLQWRQGKIGAAIATFKECVDLLQTSMEKYPGMIGPRKELAVALNNLGLVLSKNGNYFEAAASFERSISLITTITESNPTDLEGVKQAAGIWNNFGIAKANISETLAAMNAFDKAIYYQEQLANLSPINTNEKRILEKYRENKTFWSSASSGGIRQSKKQ